MDAWGGRRKDHEEEEEETYSQAKPLSIPDFSPLKLENSRLGRYGIEGLGI